MSNEHLDAIRRILAEWEDVPWVKSDLRGVSHHAEALAAELEQAEARVARFERIAAEHPTILAMRLHPSGWMVTFDSEWDSSETVDAISRASLIEAIETAHGDPPDEEATR